MRGSHKWPVDSTQKGSLMRKAFPCLDVTVTRCFYRFQWGHLHHLNPLCYGLRGLAGAVIIAAILQGLHRMSIWSALWLSRWIFSPYTYNNRQSVPIMAKYRGLLITKKITNSPLWASYQIHKIVGAHALGMPGTFSPSPQVSDPGMHHGTCVTHVPWCMPGSLTNAFLWNRRRGETFPAFPAHAHPQFCVSGKRPMGPVLLKWFNINLSVDQLLHPL